MDIYKDWYQDLESKNKVLKVKSDWFPMDGDPEKINNNTLHFKPKNKRERYRHLSSRLHHYFFSFLFDLTQLQFFVHI